MSLLNFTLEHDQFAAAQDSSDEGADADLIPLVGEIYFTPEFPDDSALLAPQYLPRPSGFKILKFTGYIGMDGRMRSSRSGAIGVRLPANDPVLALTKLRYRVDWKLTTPIGEPVPIKSAHFDAPSVDTTIYLADALNGVPPRPPSNLIDGGFFNSPASDLVDSGAPNSASIDLFDGGTP